MAMMEKMMREQRKGRRGEEKLVVEDMILLQEQIRESGINYMWLIEYK